MEGYIKLSRSFFDNEIWQAARAFSDCEAWLDLIQSARFEASPTTSRIGSYEVTWGRGQYPASNRFLAKKWGRSEQWVKTFLGKLKRKGMITTDNSQGVNVITLINFSKYNGDASNNPPNNPPNELSIIELQRLITHLTTHPLSYNEREQPTTNPNNKKEEESYKENSLKREKESFGDIDWDESLTACKKELESDIGWAQIVTMNTRFSGYTDFTLDAFRHYLDKFFQKLENEGTKNKSLRDAKAHFARWLNIELQKQKDNESNRRTNYTSKQEANEYAYDRLQQHRRELEEGMAEQMERPF